VQDVEVVWINDAKEDFVLDAEVRRLEQINGGRLRVTRVLDREAGNADTLFNSQLRGAASLYQAGSMAVVLAEDAAVGAKAERMFAALGYPPSRVVTLANEC
jgi:hypothetical protein